MFSPKPKGGCLKRTVAHEALHNSNYSMMALEVFTGEGRPSLPIAGSTEMLKDYLNTKQSEEVGDGFGGEEGWVQWTSECIDWTE